MSINRRLKALEDQSGINEPELVLIKIMTDQDGDVMSATAIIDGKFHSSYTVHDYSEGKPYQEFLDRARQDAGVTESDTVHFMRIGSED